MTYDTITNDIIDEMLNDIVMIKLNSYIKEIGEFSEN
jgi:hypothetical protein